MANISVNNLEDFPLIDAYLVVEIVSGSEHIYPSELSDENNVFYERIIPGVNLDKKSGMVVPFSYTLPVDLKSGDYTLSVYLTTERTPVVGAPSIFLSPKTAGFSVQGGGDFPHAYIVRDQTVFVNETGPVGVGVDAGSLVNATVKIAGDPSAAGGLLLNVTVCAWDDTSCRENGLFWNKEYPVSFSDGAGDVSVSFEAPDKPDAYAVRLELLSGGRMVSLYRSRIVVKGETAKIRKVAVDKSAYGDNDAGKVLVLVGASPDHYTRPVTNEAIISAYITNLENDVEVYRDTSVIPVLSLEENGGFESVVFRFGNAGILRNFSVCCEVSSKTGLLFDKYCFTIDDSKIKNIDEDAAILNASWDYDYDKSSLKVSVCMPSESLSKGSSGLQAAAFLLKSDNTVVGSSEDLTLSPCAQAFYNTGPGDYVLTVNDMKDNKQYVYDVKIAAEKKGTTSTTLTSTSIAAVATSTTTGIVCGDGICSVGEDSVDCCADCGCSGGKECSGNVCRTVTHLTGDKGKAETDPAGFYYVIAFLVLIVAVFLVYKKRRIK